MYICQTVHVACVLSNFGFCTVNLPRSCCHLCWIFVSLSLVLSATYCKSQITASLLVMWAWLRSGTCSFYALVDLGLLCIFWDLLSPSHPVSTICILEILFKYFYNPLYCIFNSVNCTKFTFCSKTQSACSPFCSSATACSRKNHQFPDDFHFPS